MRRSKKIVKKDEVKRLNQTAEKSLNKNSREYKAVIEKHRLAWKQLADK